MRRQVSARLENTLLDSTYYRGRCKRNNVVRFTSTEVLSRTRTLNLVGRYVRQHEYLQRQKRQQYCSCQMYNINKTNYYLFHRDLPSFCGLRACYFSNMAERTKNDNVIDVNDSASIATNNGKHQISTELGHIFGEEEDPKKFNFVKTLKLWYLQNHGEIGSVVQDAFETKMIQNPNSNHVASTINGLDKDYKDGDAIAVVNDAIRQIFTATFTCPLSNKRFEAGKLAGCYEIDDQNFYRRKKTALQAVSAVVLSHKLNADDGWDCGDGDGDGKHSITFNNDQYTFRQILQRLYMKHFKMNLTQNQSRIVKQDFVGKKHGGTWWTAEFICPITSQVYEAVDLPNDVVSDSMSMKEAGKIWYRKKTDSIHASASNAIESIDWDVALHTLQEENLKAGSRERDKYSNSDEELKDFLYPLLFWYKERGHEDLKLSIQDNVVVTEGSDLRNDEGHKLWTASFLCPLRGERFDCGSISGNNTISYIESDGLIWYMKKDAAIQAASKRAYDIFKYRFTGVNDPRFCKEDPSNCTSEPYKLSTVIKIAKDSFVADDEETSDNEVMKDCFFTSEQDENISIEVIPQQINISSGSHTCSSRTLDVIAQAWIDSTGVPDLKENFEFGIENFHDAHSERGKAICRALEWVSRHEKKRENLSSCRTQFDIKCEMCNLKIANLILSSLAECHQRVPFDSQRTGVEECATLVLESMWSSPITKPDAQSYAFYLKCLEGETPREVIAKAQELVNAMESGHNYNQRSLPKPNGAIYSSLTELKALSGMDPMLESDDINCLDRNTHLCKLCSMAHDTNTFDIDIATRLIDKMRTLSETNDEPYLQPDIEIYNAPLRWNGGHLWSRLYTRVIPWDSYSDIYKNGFKSVSRIEVQRKYAERVEQWIEIMKAKASRDTALTPNIETYESLIQAWVRCGNIESLLHAESIAKDIIAGEYAGIKPRIQTFFPILAAWTYSGCEEGPQKVELWIDLLKELVPELEPGLSFPSIPIMAQICLQRQVLNRLNDSSDEVRSHMKGILYDSAMNCSKLLYNTIDQFKESPDSLVQSDIYLLVLNVWLNVASEALLKDDLEETRKCFVEIQNIVNHFDDFLLWFYEMDDGQSAGTQFLKILNLAPSIYGAQLTAFDTIARDLNKFQNVASKHYDRSMCLIEIEEKILRLEEFHLFWGDDSNSINDETLQDKIGADAIPIFPSERFTDHLSCTWSDYIDSSLDFIEKGSNDSSIGEPDFTRLSTTIARVTSSATPAVLDFSAKNRIVKKVVSIFENYCGNIHDREAVISTVIYLLRKLTTIQASEEKRRVHSGGSKDNTNGELNLEKSEELRITDINAKQKLRREKTYRNGLHRSSYPRFKVLKRTLRRRASPHHAKENDS